MINLFKNKLKLFLPVITLLDAILLALLTSPSYQTKSTLGASILLIDEAFIETYADYRKEKIVDGLLKSMDRNKKVGQIFMLSIPGTSLDPKTKELIQKYNIGGIAFLGGNIANETQLKTLTNEINKDSPVDPIIAVDQEGSVVNRIYWDTTIGKPITIENIRSRGSLLASLGINMNLAPVADIPLVQNSFIKSRALGSNVNEVTTNALAVLSGHEENNILTSAKHFPGHGRTTSDSHKNLPVINISKEELNANELVPFKKLIDSGAPVIMTGHLLFPKIDSEPASLSRTFQTNILRHEMGFSGLIISDDMNMGGIRSDVNRFEKAIKAGTNMIIYVQFSEVQIKIIDSLIQKSQTDTELSAMLEDSVRRILLTKCEYKILEECN